MDNKNDTGQVPLLADDNYDIQPLISGDRRRRRRHFPQICLWLLVLEIANILLFMGGPPILARIRRPKQHHLDDYFKLAQFNKTIIYDPEVASSNNKWDEVYLQYGIVSIGEDWASRHGFPPSTPTPENPGEMVYQVDVFHNLHCLTRIREHYLSNKTASISDTHTLHCFNHLRQSLMCAADLMLGVAEDFKDFGLDETHTCRDYDAIVQWVERNKWKGFLDWTSGNHNL